MFENYLNKQVDVIIDRPLGSAHPKFKDCIYPVNYGYVPNVFSGDNEELDVYVLRVDKPLKKFCGKVVAIIKRKNDVEEKLVVMPQDNCNNVTKEEIIEKTFFIEQYFDIEVVI